MAQKIVPPIVVTVESCGVGNWSVGQMPDERMRLAAAERGVILASRAQQFNTTFYDKFNYILAVDDEVLNLLLQYAKRADQKAKIHLLSEYSSGYRGQGIPDPYYHGDAAFDHVLDMLEDCCYGLLNHIKEQR
jgi:protein-tyrosine phosphatase